MLSKLPGSLIFVLETMEIHTFVQPWLQRNFLMGQGHDVMRYAIPGWEKDRSSQLWRVQRWEGIGEGIKLTRRVRGHGFHIAKKQ